MLKHSSRPSFLSAAVLLCALVASPFASAACGCPSDGHGNGKFSGSGLGESFPMSADLAADPAWQVYEFERDGVRYVQVNDKAGRVSQRAIVSMNAAGSMRFTSGGPFLCAE